MSAAQRSQCVSAVNLHHVGVKTPKRGFAVPTGSLCSAVNLSHVKVKKLKSGLPVPSDNCCCRFFLEWGVNIVNPHTSMVGPSLSGNPHDIHLAASNLDKNICSQLLGIFNRQSDRVSIIVSLPQLGQKPIWVP